MTMLGGKSPQESAAPTPAAAADTSADKADDLPF